VTFREARDALLCGELSQARTACDQLLQESAADAQTLHLAGQIAVAERDFELALRYFDSALRVDPDQAATHFDRAVLLQRLQRHEPAIRAYDRLVRLRPRSADARCNRGAAFAALNRLDEAIDSFDEAIALSADHAGAHFSRAVVWLLQGRLREGFAEFEWRWRTEPAREIAARWRFRRPPWLGESSIAGKTILVYAERGLGDTLQFCRYVPKLAALGATVYLQVQPPLLQLLSHLPGVAQVFTDPEEAPVHDYHCPLLSLPLAFGTDVGSVPSETYLHASAERVAHYRASLAAGNAPRVGLVWRGDRANPDDVNRSIPIATILEHLPSEFRYVSLQYDPSPAELKRIATAPLSFTSCPDLGFVDTAALCESLDLILCADTSTAHLSGALGRPTWLMLPFSPDCRWMLNRSESPWYPSMRLYRQAVFGQWDEVFERVTADLKSHFRG
jgi:tetratricopeptide (TPR) repeat protein